MCVCAKGLVCAVVGGGRDCGLRGTWRSSMPYGERVRQRRYWYRRPGLGLRVGLWNSRRGSAGIGGRDVAFCVDIACGYLFLFFYFFFLVFFSNGMTHLPVVL